MVTRASISARELPRKRKGVLFCMKPIQEQLSESRFIPFHVTEMKREEQDQSKENSKSKQDLRPIEAALEQGCITAAVCFLCFSLRAVAEPVYLQT